MAAKGQSYADKSSRWEVVVTNAKAEVEKMPHLAEDLTALGEKIQEVRTLGSRQDDLRSQVRELTAQIQAVVREGERIRGRLGASLRGKFGFDSEALVKYGFKPRPNVIRRRGKAKPAPEVVKPAEKS
jgi:outer membrane murein-binding lipoprotein Lpp